MPAKAKLIKNINESIQTLVDDIKKRHTYIATETELLEADKNKLKEFSVDHFLADIDTLDIHGNHEYHTTNGEIVCINMKVKGRPMERIGDNNASKVLRSLFKESYENLFEEQNHITVTSDQDTQLGQAVDNPELFRISLKSDLTADQLKNIVEVIPQFVQVSIHDLSKYEKLYPKSTEKKTSVIVKCKFLENLAKVDKIILDKAKGFIKGYFNKKDGKVITLQPAVVCGNAGKK